MSGPDELTTLVRAQAAEMEAWQAAEVHLLGQALRERLLELGVAPTADVAVALMAAATLLAPYTPEWGGHARCTLGEVALLGLELLGEDAPDPA